MDYINGILTDEDGFLYDDTDCKLDKYSPHNKYTIQNIKHYIEINGITTKLVSSEYIGAQSKLDFVCDCGTIYSTIFAHFRDGQRKCRECNLKNSYKTKSRMLKYADIVEKMNELGLELLTEEQPEDTLYSKIKITVRNKECMMWQGKYNTLVTNNGNFSPTDYRNPYAISNINIILEGLGIKAKLKENQKFDGTHKASIFICSKCGKEFLSNVCSVIYNKLELCDECRPPSSLEDKTYKYLKANKILFIQQKRFDDCRDTRPLPFDFYLPEYNICIECQGKQHYVSMGFFGGDDGLLYLNKHDSIKREYCKSNGIKLIELPYWVFKKEEYKNILNKELQQRGDV